MKRKTVHYLLLFLTIVLWHVPEGDAQTVTRSHRLLPLPEESTDSLPQQFQLLQQLQRMVNARSESPQDPSQLHSDLLQAAEEFLDPEQKQQLERLRDQWIQQGLGGEPKDADNEVLKNLQQEVAKLLAGNSSGAPPKLDELLRQFSRDRQLPFRGSRRGDFGPESQASRPGTTFPSAPNDRNDSSPMPSSRDTAPQTSDSTAETNRTHLPAPSGGPGRGPLAELPSSEPFANPLSDARMRGPGNDANNAPSRLPNGSSALAPESLAELRRRWDSATLETPAESGSQKSLRGITPPELGPGLAENHQSPLTERDRLEALRSGAASGRETRSDENIRQFAQQLSDLVSESGLQEGSAPSMSELLRQAKENPGSLPPLDIPPNSLHALKDWIAQRLPPESPDSTKQLLNNLKNALPRDVREELTKSGLESTLRSLVRDARSRSANGPGRSSAPDRNTNHDAARSLEPNRVDANTASPPDLSQIVKNFELPSSRDSSKRNTSPAKANPPKAKEAGDSDSPGFFERLSGLYQQFATPPEPPLPTSSSSTANSSETLGSNRMALVFFALLALGVTIIAVWQVNRFGTQGWSIPGRPAHPRDAFQIRNRHDIIRVFHHLANESSASAERWWPHRRTARAMAEANPAADSHVHALAQLYELARYGPQDEPLSEEQLSSARRALERYSVC